MSPFVMALTVTSERVLALLQGLHVVPLLRGGQGGGERVCRSHPRALLRQAREESEVGVLPGPPEGRQDFRETGAFLRLYGAIIE